MHDWNALLKEAYRCCAPGGWVQSCECDVEFRSDDGTAELEPVLKTWGQLFREGGNILGRPFFVQELQQEAFDKAGFIEKKSSYYKVCAATMFLEIDAGNNKAQIPIGGWPKDPKLAEVGRFVRSTLENDLEGKQAPSPSAYEQVLTCESRLQSYDVARRTRKAEGRISGVACNAAKGDS